MNSYLESKLDLPVGKLFDSDDFKAFVYDFYYGLPEADEGYAIGDIYRWIFSDQKMYTQFLQYCEGQNFSVVDEIANTTLKKTLRLLIFEQISQQIGDFTHETVNDVLDWTNYDIMYKSLNSYIPGTKTNLWNGLRQALYQGVPLNNFGQVLYLIEETDVGFLVYSHELGKHHVNKEGRVISRLEHYREEEAEALGEFLKYKRLIQENRKGLTVKSEEYLYEFHSYVKECKKPGDTDKLLELRFRMRIHSMLSQSQRSLKEIRRAGFGFGDLKLIGGSEFQKI